MPRRLVVVCAAALLAVGLAACTGDGATTVVDGTAKLAVTVDADGDEQQKRAMAIASRYAPEGTFTLEQESETETETSTDGDSASRSSTVVVFEVVANVDEVMERLRNEPHVLEVARR